MIRTIVFEIEENVAAILEQGAEFNSEGCGLGEDKTGCDHMFVMQIDDEEG